MAKTQGYPCSCQCCLKAHREAEQLEKEKQIIIDDLCDKWEELRSQNARLRSALQWMYDYAWDLSKRVKMNALHTVSVFKNAKEALSQLSNQGDGVGD
jgi:hypothetical protein